MNTKCFLCVWGTLEFPEVLSNTGWHFPKRGSGDAPLLEVPWALSTLSLQFETHLQRKLWPSEVRWKKWRWNFLLWNERQLYFNYCESTAMKLFQSWRCATNDVIFSVRAPRVCNYVRALWNCVGTCLFHMYLILDKIQITTVLVRMTSINTIYYCLKKNQANALWREKNVLLLVTNIDDVGHTVWWC